MKYSHEEWNSRIKSPLGKTARNVVVTKRRSPSHVGTAGCCFNATELAAGCVERCNFPDGVPLL